MVINGVLELDFSIINEHVVNFYSGLFASDHLPRDFSGVKESIPMLVSESENLMLTMMPSNKLIRSVVFNMDPNSAPGPDGFTGLFFVLVGMLLV